MAKKQKRSRLKENAFMESFFQMKVKDVANLDAREKKKIVDAVLGDAIDIKEIFSHEVCEALLEKFIEETMNKKAEEDEKMEQHDKYFCSIQKEYESANTEYEKARERMTKARKEYFKAKKELDNLRECCNKISNDLVIRQQIKEDMKKIVLIHPSVSLKQIYRYRMSKIVVNDCDADCFNRLLLYKICDTSKFENLIKVLPEKTKNGNKETESIIKYCELVANTLAYIDEDAEVILLFDSFEIAKILKQNGIKF